MPKRRPGINYYAVNNTGGTLKHDQLVVVDGIVGKAVKQKPRRWSDGLANQQVIDVNEAFTVLTKGIVEVPDPGGLAKAAPAYIAPAAVAAGVTTFAVSGVAAGNTKLGRVVEVVGDGRGVPAGMIRIDLDKKDSF